MIYLIEFNQLIKIEISCGILYQMNQIKMNLKVKQQRYILTRSKRRIGILPKKHKHTIQRKRQKISIDYRDILIYYFRLIIVNPTLNLNIKVSNIISSCFGISIVNQSN